MRSGGQRREFIPKLISNLLDELGISNNIK